MKVVKPRIQLEVAPTLYVSIHVSFDDDPPVHAGEKLSQERRERGEPWRSKNRPPEMNLRKRSEEERFVGYRRDVHRGAMREFGERFRSRGKANGRWPGSMG
jgi:hypothetical protein